MSGEMRHFKDAITHEVNHNAKITEVKIAALAVSTSLVIVGTLCLAFYLFVTREMPNRY